MPNSKSPDWWARIVALGGLFIAMAGLGLSFFTYRWQQNVYKQNLEERIYVNLSAARVIAGFSKDSTLFPRGQLAVEVVNIGLHPIYLKGVSAEIDGRPARFFEYDPLSTNASTKRLEPGESAVFRIDDWKFAEGEERLRDWSKEELSGIVEVTTTTKRLSQKAPISRISISRDFLPLLLTPGKISRKARRTNP